MKKRLIRILALVLILSISGILPMLSASALIGPQYVYTSNGKGLNIRDEPSKNGDIIGSIPYGACVDSYDYYDNSWAFVSYNGVYGYCMSRYFTSSKPGAKPNPTPNPEKETGINYRTFQHTSYYATVRPSTPSGYVNLRWAPSKSVSIQGTYYANYELHVIAENGTWAQVIDEGSGICGFMMMSFLSTSSVYVGDGIANN